MPKKTIKNTNSDEQPTNIVHNDNIDFYDNLTKEGFYFLFDEVTPASAQNIVTWILEANLMNDTVPSSLKLIINSPGGDVNCAFAVIDVMKGSKIPVYTYGLGLVASAALGIFMAGEPGKRFLTPNTSILSHQYFWGTFGKEHELFAIQKEYDLTSQRIIAHYEKCTKMSKKDIRKYLLPPNDVWLSAKEAHEFNICDEIKNIY